jgi:hypothetical protein
MVPIGRSEAPLESEDRSGYRHDDGATLSARRIQLVSRTSGRDPFFDCRSALDLCSVSQQKLPALRTSPRRPRQRGIESGPLTALGMQEDDRRPIKVMGEIWLRVLDCPHDQLCSNLNITPWRMIIGTSAGLCRWFANDGW